MRPRSSPSLPGRGATPRRAAALFATAALLTAAGCGGESDLDGTTVSGPSDAETAYLDDPCTRPSGHRRKRFHVTDEGFKPRKTVVRSGIPVTFINCGDKPHSITKAAGRGKAFDSGTLQPRQKYEVTLASIGTLTFVDRHNPEAKMTIEVSGLPGEPQN
jgi:plastocyanin